MIQVRLSDGTSRMLDEAEVKLTWTEKPGQEGEEPVEHEYNLADVNALIFLDPSFDLMHGIFSGMPIVGIRIADPTDLRIEVPMPVEVALEMAEQLPIEVKKAKSLEGSERPAIPIFRSLPGRMPKPPGGAAA